MTMMIDKNHPDHIQATIFIEAWQEGIDWATSLKVGDRFLGSMGEATARYGIDNDYAVKAFTVSGYGVLKSMHIYLDDCDIITKIEK